MNTEKINLYNRAKEAYYNGNPIMEDFEFDALEKELGLENKSYVGTRHNPSYIIEHPYLMGSLSKVQIHKKDGIIDWPTYYHDACNYFFKTNKNSSVIITPKYDGCSFEAYIENDEVKSISTRGDGEYGKDISAHLINKVKCNLLGKQVNGYSYTLRGEVLIDKVTFAEKYSEFVNPRSFVAGILGRDYDPYNAEFLAMVNDLSIVIYDIRVKLPNDLWFDYDWDNFNYPDSPTFYEKISSFTLNDFINTYNKFATYRNECPFALDGIVIKPTSQYRIGDITEHRPKDCVAIKFIPMLQETEVIDITWKVGKTGEYNPVVITKPVIMDGKSITKASAHNYGYLLDNKISIGTKVILSLAGDIIPFIYKITDTSVFDDNNMNVPENTYVEGCHLMAMLDDTEIAHLNFKNSAATLNIPNLGPAETENIWNYITKDNDETDDFFAEDMLGFDSSMVKINPNNILLISPEDVYFGITSATKNGATGKAKKIKKAFEDIVRNITLKDIIKSCNFTSCGDKVAEQCANYLMNDNYDFTHLASKGYEWCLDENNCSEEGPTNNLGNVLNILASLGKTFDDFKQINIETSDSKSNQIPVILTGEPNDYKSKGEFLSCHPEYRMTGSWKEVQIVFTNDLSSNTGKMKKAREKNIEIRVY